MDSSDIIILTDARYETPDEGNWYVAQLLSEERLLLAGLEARGLRTARVAWSNPDFDWSRTRAAVFRSTWDYFERFTDHFANDPDCLFAALYNFDTMKSHTEVEKAMLNVMAACPAS